MEIQGGAALPAPAETVFQRLMDPAVLVRCVPGCKELSAQDEGRYTVAMELGVAAVRGHYDGEIAIRDVRPPEGYTLHIAASGAPGYVEATIGLSLSEEAGSTRLAYAGDVEVGGMIAGVGQRMLGGLSKIIAKQFFDQLAQEVAGR